MEKRKNKRIPFQAKVKIGYFLDDLELCNSIDCDKGKALKVIDGIITTQIVDCTACGGYGFKQKVRK